MNKNNWFKTWWGIPLIVGILIFFIILFSILNKDCNCPELNCSTCPAKIEYKTKEVENKIYIDKPIYKFQCFNGDIKNNQEECDNIISYLDSQKNIINDAFCAKLENKNYEKISIYNAFEKNQFLDKSNIYKYYPSLNEGWIYYYPIYIENSGCTKLDLDKFLTKSSVYLNNKLIHSYDSKINNILVDYMYPEDEQMYSVALAGYDDFSETDTILIIGTDQGPIKITSAGNYIVRVSIYYNNKKIADIDDVIIIN
ncbi:MAG TPA: hypothetical protein PK685_04465 [archaeon]|nr:hypothetical protein [archaeon]